jgi:hypothetical protein
VNSLNKKDKILFYEETYITIKKHKYRLVRINGRGQYLIYKCPASKKSVSLKNVRTLKEGVKYCESLHE